MFCSCVVMFIIFLYMMCDVNYVIRTCFAVITGRLYLKNMSLGDTSVNYGLCTFQDCDVYFKELRLARIVREIDFARYHFYVRTGIYRRSRKVGIKSLQGSTLTLLEDSIPLFTPYKINTKLVYWDDRSLFFGHEVITLHDSKLRHLLVSRQYAIGKNKDSTVELLRGLPGSTHIPKCPQYIKHWLKSMEISSKKLRNAL